MKCVTLYHQATVKGKPAAVKVIDLEKTTDDYRLKFLPRELYTMKKLHHPYVIEVLEIFVVGNRVLVFMVRLVFTLSICIECNIDSFRNLPMVGMESICCRRTNRLLVRRRFVSTTNSLDLLSVTCTTMALHIVSTYTLAALHSFEPYTHHSLFYEQYQMREYSLESRQNSCQVDGLWFHSQLH